MKVLVDVKIDIDFSELRLRLKNDVFDYDFSVIQQICESNKIPVPHDQSAIKRFIACWYIMHIVNGGTYNYVAHKLCCDEFPGPQLRKYGILPVAL